MIAKSNKLVQETVKLIPCCHCGSENLEIFNCGYSSFNVAGVNCKECGYEMHLNGADWGMSDTDIAKTWNKDNNIDKNIVAVELQIENLQRRVIKLKNLKK